MLYIMLFVLLGITGFFVERDSNKSVEQYNDIASNSTRKMSLLADARKRIIYIEVATFRHILAHDNSDKFKEEKIIERIHEEDTQLLNEFENLISTGDEQKLYENLNLKKKNKS